MPRILIEKTPNFIGKKVSLAGFVDKLRDHGKVLFLDLKDQSGILQVVFSGKIYQKAKNLSRESIVRIEGKIRERPAKMINPKVPTGKIEAEASSLKIISKVKKLPITPEELLKSREELRFKYRYLDLRRKKIREIFEIRHKVNQFIREFLTKKGFIEIETPILSKSTPEGARDFLVPSRLHPGKFYALPQSPQQYKQILMVGGIERYFQIARCFRDEDPRADRQAEFTQLDLEMAFIEDKEPVLKLIEELLLNLIKKLFPQKKMSQFPFLRLDAREAIKKYGTDKPDLRKNPEGKPPRSRTFGSLRGKSASYGASKKDPNELAFCFITDFPMFEWRKSERRWDCVHHPFTKPKTEDIKEIKKNPQKILAHQYDLVLNGYELGGGSLRTTDLKIFEAVFEVLGHSKKEIKEKFGHLFEAFSCGVPPHGGIAIGLDRLLATFLNKENIREVIVFPKSGDGRDFLMESPSKVEESQLKELHLKITKPNSR